MTAQNILDALKLADVSIGILFSMFGGVAALIVWMMRTRSSVTQELERGDQALSQQIDKELGRIQAEASELRRVVVSQGEAINAINIQMATLAHARELAQVREDIAKISGEQREIHGKVDTVFRAIISARKDASND